MSKQFTSMLLEQKTILWIYHKNLTCNNTEHARYRVLRQRLILEQFVVELRFIQKIKNEAADMLS